ncbi:hypothetical protein FRC03_012837 [Tulasnella sp. 419]|nr:hypothetical protein FRC03_012837 [Tulasnella sp. 419]
MKFFSFWITFVLLFLGASAAPVLRDHGLDTESSSDAVLKVGRGWSDYSNRLYKKRTLHDITELVGGTSSSQNFARRNDATERSLYQKIASGWTQFVGFFRRLFGMGKKVPSPAPLPQPVIPQSYPENSIMHRIQNSSPQPEIIQAPKVVAPARWCWGGPIAGFIKC